MQHLTPLISIIIPTYNRAGMLGRAISSVITQSFGDWELIIVDDGSDDNTKEIVSSAKDVRIRYVFQENQERCIARNTGISLARGLYIGFLDSDDYFLPDHLQGFKIMIDSRNYPLAMFVSGLYIEENGVLKERLMYNEKLLSPLRFAWQTVILPGSVCLHRDILKKYKFSEQYHIWEDRHLWLRILTEYPLIQTPDYTSVLFEHKNRSTKLFYRKISIYAVKLYFASVKNLMLTHGKIIKKEFSEKELKNFVVKKYLSFLHVSVKNAQVNESLYLIARLLYINPAFLFSLVFFKLLFLIPVNKFTQSQIMLIN